MKMPVGERDRLLTTSEAADFLRIHKNTLLRMEKRGELESFKISGRGDKRYLMSNLYNLLKEPE